MKKIFFVLSAFALFGLASCVDQINKADINPTFDPETNTVNTKFVLNVATGSTPTTKQSAATVQLPSTSAAFRGLQDARIYGLITGTAASASFIAPFDGSTIAAASRKYYEMGTLYTSGMVDLPTNMTASSRRVIELSMPVQTDAVLVYARAIPNGTDAANGKVTITYADDPKDITFDLTSRLGTDATNLTHTQNLVAMVLNRICTSELAADATGYTHKGVTASATLDAISWRALGRQYGINIGKITPGTGEGPVNLTALEEILGETYYKFTTIGSGEYRAGSANSVLRMVYELEYSVTSVLNATATSDKELNAQRLAGEISGRINNYFDNATDKANIAFKQVAGSTGSISDNLVAHAGIPATAFQTGGEAFGVTDAMIGAYPQVFRIPAGASLLTFTEYGTGTPIPGGFSFKTAANSLITANQTFDPSHFMYPAELLYFDNSQIRVTNTEVAEANYPNGVTPWVTAGSWTADNWAVGKVLSSTRGVAVMNNINYGVAMLKSSVAWDDSNTSNTLKDNRSAFYTSENPQEFTQSASLFTLTGILVGGQNHQMNWQYLAKANAASDWDYIVYDTEIPNSGVVPTTADNEVYTLVFDNYDASGTQSDVYVALEFKNEMAKDFYGRDNVIRSKGTFYLVGKLALGSNKIASWDTTYPVPPYAADGTSTQTTRIFTQDFMTTAVFKIGENSLKNAYVTVPDLRSSQMSFGLSVDLQWQTGLSFPSVILGSN